MPHLKGIFSDLNGRLSLMYPKILKREFAPLALSLSRSTTRWRVYDLMTDVQLHTKKSTFFHFFYQIISYRKKVIAMILEREAYQILDCL